MDTSSGCARARLSSTEAGGVLPRQECRFQVTVLAQEPGKSQALGSRLARGRGWPIAHGGRRSSFTENPEVHQGWCGCACSGTRHRRDSVQLPPPARPLSAPPPPLQNRGCYCKERVTPLLESSGCKLPLLCVYNFPQTCTSLRAQGPRKTIASITRTSTTKDTPGRHGLSMLLLSEVQR
ncbi:uncharacterized protein [Oryctolagus cuniculus]|uniref:uncharacterized protein n=1 Tax=Oryctolagus cuniculus TaxID=9986 RepID=UPI003879D7DD